ncbi:TIGR04140 family protein [Thermococcus sp.]|uniref:TIGR04140 family protein n=1 Tax=Thermococcus sp. TaxID=35749 RepID=UPI002600498B|nr:TIGR04140 family protein [Thermococcus sp.]
MRLQITTAIPPGELGEILRKSGARVSISVEETEEFHGMPRWSVLIEGVEDEIQRFMETLRLARAGG